MAAPMDWRLRLNDHPIFRNLRENSGKIRPGTESKDLVVIKDGEIYVWNPFSACILTLNLKNLTRETESRSHEDQHDQCQTLRLTVPPVFDVESLLFNLTGSHLALVGKQGVYSLELPQRYGKFGAYGGGKDTILCRTVPIAERFFVCSVEKILHVAWHPGSTTDSHLVVLTSDNYVRLYSISKPQTAEQTFRLNISSNPYGASSLSVHTALGDTAVSFDFGEPTFVAVPRRPTGRLRAIESASNAAGDSPGGGRDREGRGGGDKLEVWPMYILWGNGEVYQLMTCLKGNLPYKASVQGPLAMYPPAEDNYGTDACSILCLRTRPPVLVTATAEGKLYHCVALNREDDNKSLVSTSDTTEGSLPYEPQPEPTLFVYESIELELSLTTVSLDTDEPITDDFSCPIRLHRDPGGSERYHCSHGAGIHSVIIPWIGRIQEYCDTNDDADLDLPQRSPDSQAIVEHLVCTKPLPSSPCSPILGLGLVCNKLLGSTLVCLTATLECIVLPLLQHIKTSAPPLLSEQPLKRGPSPLKRLQRESFDLHIQRILQRSTSNPLLKSSKETRLSPQECFQLLSRSTQVFREEYILKQIQARQEIDRRVLLLREQKEQQVDTVQGCHEEKNKLTERAEELAEKYEEVNDMQNDLVHRIESVLKKIQSRLPTLSNAEYTMHKELSGMDDNLKQYKAHIQQLKLKQDYQGRQIGHARASSLPSPRVFSKTQTHQLRTMLQDEGDDIGDLVKQVTQLKVNLDT